MVWYLCLAIFVAPYPEHEQDGIQEIVEEHALSRRVRDMAIQAGLPKKDANELTVDLGTSSLYPPFRESIAYWENKEGFDLFSFLKGVVQLAELPFEAPSLYKTLQCRSSQLSQRTTLNWIAVCDDPRSTEWFIKYLNDVMIEPIKTKDDADRIRALIRTLGYDGSDRALDFLFRLQSREAWENAPPVQILTDEESSDSKDNTVLSLRRAAVTGIALSGTDRALHAFGTGEGLADDMWPSGMFSTAAHAHFGMYALGWHYRKGLEPEVKKELQAIYDEYGVEYLGEKRYKSNVVP